MSADRLRALLARGSALVRASAADGGALLARLALGQAFLLTGWGKLTHLERTTEFFASLTVAGVIPLPAPGLHAVAVGMLELLGGGLLLLGLFTRSTAVVLLALMAGAIATADWAGFTGALALSPETGLTDVVPAMFALVLLPLLAFGGGRIAVDRLVARWRVALPPAAPQPVLG